MAAQEVTYAVQPLILFVSRTAISKWESGICLPDVSAYLELCEILGISLNEFLAGEDIEIDNIEKGERDFV